MRALALRASLAVAVLAAASTPTAANPGEPIPLKARKLAERGRELHDRGDYARAIVAFKEAYVLAPSPGLLFNLAQAYRLQGNCDDAALMYRRYIASTPPWSAERSLAEAHLASVVRCVQKRSLNLPPDEARAHISMQSLERDPLFSDEVPRQDGGSPGRAARSVGLGLAIGGAVALGTAAVYGVKAFRAADDVEQRYAGGTPWSELEPIHARGERAESMAKWFAIGGGISAAAGVTLFVLGRRAERATPPVAVTPMKGGARVGVSWAF